MATEMDKAKAEQLARKMRRSIKSIQSVLELAKTNGGNIPAAARTLGRTQNYVNSGMFYLRAAERVNKVRVPEIAKLETAIRSVKRVKRNARLEKFESTGATAVNKPEATRKVKSRNVLSHLVEENVEYRYPVIANRPIVKKVETYPLRALQPGQAFAVPARKGEIMAAKKAVTRFSRQNPGVKFLQQVDKREFVTWRTE